MASKGRVDRTGSDGSTPKSRILNAGYGQWTIGPVIDEAIYGGTGGTQGALDWWLSTDTDERRIVSNRFREIGIGAATAANGWVYWTLDLGAQPNVLPAFVNGGVSSVDTTAITLTLTTENAVPSGEGVSTLGQPVQVRVGLGRVVYRHRLAALGPAGSVPAAGPGSTKNLCPLSRYRRTHRFVLDCRDVDPCPAGDFYTLAHLDAAALHHTLADEYAQANGHTAADPHADADRCQRKTATFAPLPSGTAALVGTPPGASVAQPRPTLRPRTTPTAVAAGPYSAPPSALLQAVCVLQTVALVLAALSILRRSLHRLPTVPVPPQASTHTKDLSQRLPEKP